MRCRYTHGMQNLPPTALRTVTLPDTGVCRRQVRSRLLSLPVTLSSLWLTGVFQSSLAVSSTPTPLCSRCPWKLSLGQWLQPHVTCLMMPSPPGTPDGCFTRYQALPTMASLSTGPNRADYSGPPPPPHPLEFPILIDAINTDYCKAFQ